MITKFIYNILSQDDTDENQAAALQEVQLINPDVTSLSAVEYYYKSLKTLLGDTSSTWYKNKIYFEEYTRQHDNWLSSDTELPKINIGLANNNLTRSRNDSGRDLEGEILINLRTKDTSSSRDIINLSQRVRRVLEPKNSVNNHARYCEVMSQYEVSNINLWFLRMNPFLVDRATLYYKVLVSFY